MNETAQPADKYHRAANEWDSSLADERDRSSRRAWRVAGVAAAIAALEAVAIVSMMPLKDIVYREVRIDSDTGMPDVVTVLAEQSVTRDEVTATYMLAQYVMARETYDWYTLQDDYDKVGLFSTRSVADEYKALFEGDDALDKRYGSKTRATIEIVSVVPTSDDTGTVRFTKTTERVGAPGQGTVTRWVATVGFTYLDVSRMKASLRLINPYGFQVRSWRVDPEMPGGDR